MRAFTARVVTLVRKDNPGGRPWEEVREACAMPEERLGPPDAEGLRRAKPTKGRLEGQ